jgi:hypothetical protein
MHRIDQQLIRHFGPWRQINLYAKLVHGREIALF